MRSRIVARVCVVLLMLVVAALGCVVRAEARASLPSRNSSTTTPSRFAAVGTFTITPSVIGGARGHGTITPSIRQTVDYGATPEFSFVPEAGYHIKSVTVGSIPAVPKMVFVGDSLTHGCCATTEADSFPALVTARFIGNSELAGMTGGQSKDVDLASVTAAAGDIVVIELGTNDVSGYPVPSNPADFEANLRAIAEAARAGNAACRFILLSVWQGAPACAPYNARIAAVATDYGGQFVDLSAIHDDPLNIGPAGTVTYNSVTDNFHPNNAGHAAIAAAVGDAIATGERVAVAGNNTYTFPAVTANHTISVEFTVNTKPALGTPTCPAYVKAGQQFEVFGSLRPNLLPAPRPTVKVTAYCCVGDTWQPCRTFAAVNADSGRYSEYSAEITIPRAGRYRFKASTAATAKYFAATSGFSRTLTVK